MSVIVLDAEIASLIAPRSLIIEYSSVPEIIENIEKLQEKPSRVNGFPPVMEGSSAVRGETDCHRKPQNRPGRQSGGKSL